MSLTEIIRKIAEVEGIPDAKIIWDEVSWFEQEHGEHGAYRLGIYRDEEGKASSINCECDPQSSYIKCSHRDAPILELEHSLFYQSYVVDELELQKKRREGRLTSEDLK